MNTRKLRVYTFIKFTDKTEKDTPKLKIILGKEAVLHIKALCEMRDTLSMPNAKKQCETIKAQLQQHQPIINEQGRPIARGPWQGGNFGGVLLIGRPALPGGRVEDDDVDVPHAALRELIEEFRISPLIMEDSTLREMVLSQFQLVCTIERPNSRGIVEHYYQLDLDIFVGTTLEQYLNSQDIIGLFSVSRLINDDNDDNDNEKLLTRIAASMEKQSLYCVSLDKLKEQFGDELLADDENFMRPNLETLAKEVCALVGAKGCEEECARQLMEFQKSRNMRTAFEAADQFLKQVRKDETNSSILNVPGRGIVSNIYKKQTPCKSQKKRLGIGTRFENAYLAANPNISIFSDEYLKKHNLPNYRNYSVTPTDKK